MGGQCANSLLKNNGKTLTVLVGKKALAWQPLVALGWNCGKKSSPLISRVLVEQEDFWSQEPCNPALLETETTSIVEYSGRCMEQAQPVRLVLIVNDCKFLFETVFFSHTNQPIVLLHEPATKWTSQPNRLRYDGRLYKSISKSLSNFTWQILWFANSQNYMPSKKTIHLQEFSIFDLVK